MPACLAGRADSASEARRPRRSPCFAVLTPLPSENDDERGGSAALRERWWDRRGAGGATAFPRLDGLPLALPADGGAADEASATTAARPLDGGCSAAACRELSVAPRVVPLRSDAGERRDAALLPWLDDASLPAVARACASRDRRDCSSRAALASMASEGVRFRDGRDDDGAASARCLLLAPAGAPDPARPMFALSPEPTLPVKGRLMTDDRRARSAASWARLGRRSDSDSDATGSADAGTDCAECKTPFLTATRLCRLGYAPAPERGVAAAAAAVTPRPRLPGAPVPAGAV